jgi:hypothetical protein
MTEVLEGGNFNAIDEVLAPTYVNTGMGGVALQGRSSMAEA